MRLTHRDEYCRWCSDGSKASLQLGYEDYPSILRGDAVDKLAAYEDTGLSPEEFKEKSESVLELYGKLKPYADAEEQGRLVILPCKVGDTVFYYSRKDRMVLALKCEGYLHTGVAWKVRCTDVIPSWIGNQKRHFYLMANSFGKTVFLTREEAEAALKGGQDDGT